MSDPTDVPKYRNAAHAAYTIVKEEGISTLYRGVALTALRQATNQAANFTAYGQLKSMLQTAQPELEQLPSYQTAVAGLISGAVGPFTNAPIVRGQTLAARLIATGHDQDEDSARLGSRGRDGLDAHYHRLGDHVPRGGLLCLLCVGADFCTLTLADKGITPRVARVAPGQAVVFAVYEKVKKAVERLSETTNEYSE